jgi:UDP-3-O-[3-hydroxymyristoyl] N-acetylglucosamine deacetylase
MRSQRTISTEVFFEGIGLHTGKRAGVRLCPAPVDTGIIFQRLDKGVSIKADVFSVVETAFATTLGCDGARVRTVEHLLSALAGIGIDNLFVEIDGPEVPILDGSSTLYAGIILEAGITIQNRKKPYLKIIRPLFYESTHSKIIALPHRGFRISYYIQFNHRLLRQQELTIDIDERNFIKDIAPARTFGFLSDVEKLRKNGLAKGGSLDNAIIVGDDGIINSEGLRFSDEFVRHKILDAMGDFLLAGYPIDGHIILEKAGHTANINFLKKLLSSPESFTIVSDTIFSEFSETDAVSSKALNLYQ